MNETPLFFHFFDGFGVSGILRITPASEASQERLNSSLLVPISLLTPMTCYGPEYIRLKGRLVSHYTRSPFLAIHQLRVILVSVLCLLAGCAGDVC